MGIQVLSYVIKGLSLFDKAIVEKVVWRTKLDKFLKIRNPIRA